MQNFLYSRREESGTAIVELALAIPVFLLLLSGVIGYGSSVQEHAVMMQAARFGAYAAANRVTGTPEQITDTAVTLARRYLRGCGFSSSRYLISVRPVSEELSPGVSRTEIQVSISRVSALPAMFSPFKTCARSFYMMHGPVPPATEVADEEC